MSRTKNLLLDAAFIFGGVGLSTGFISTDGNGENPIPVAAGMLLVAGLTGVVSFALACFVRTMWLAILASIGITEFLFILYFVGRVAFSAHVDEHASEELYLLPIVFAVVTAPTILLSSIGFGRVANRLYLRRRAKSSAQPNDGVTAPLSDSEVTEGPPSTS